MACNQADGDTSHQLGKRDHCAHLQCLAGTADGQIGTHTDEERAQKRIGAGQHTGGGAANLQEVREEAVECTAQQQRDQHDAAGDFIHEVNHWDE